MTRDLCRHADSNLSVSADRAHAGGEARARGWWAKTRHCLKYSERIGLLGKDETPERDTRDDEI